MEITTEQLLSILKNRLETALDFEDNELVSTIHSAISKMDEHINIVYCSELNKLDYGNEVEIYCNKLGADGLAMLYDIM